MARITLTLYPEERDALRRMAEVERRDARQQAALLLRRALLDAGFLTAERQSEAATPTPPNVNA